jgi:hypothetical protein
LVKGNSERLSGKLFPAVDEVGRRQVTPISPCGQGLTAILSSPDHKESDFPAMSDAVSEKNTALMEKIVSLSKRRGFIFQSAEIYGGLNGCWDYGPLGAELKRNLKEYWWRKNVQEREDILGLDGSILTHQDVLRARRRILRSDV